MGLRKAGPSPTQPSSNLSAWPRRCVGTSSSAVPSPGTICRWHKEFTGTSSLYHLAPGGKYHRCFMDEAHRFYDVLAAGAIHPNGDLKHPGEPAPQSRKEPAYVVTIKYFHDFIKGFLGPVISDVKDIREQIIGGRDSGQNDGWSISQLVKNYQPKPGDQGTMPEILAVELIELEKMRTDLDDIKKTEHNNNVQRNSRLGSKRAA